MRDFAKAIGLDFDGSGRGLGIRSKRYSMLVEDGVVKKLNVEEQPGKCEVSGGDTLLEAALTFSSTQVPNLRSGDVSFELIDDFAFCHAHARPSAMASRASWSARSFRSWPAWPLTQCQFTSCARDRLVERAATDRRS